LREKINLTKYGNIKTVVKHVCLQSETWGLHVIFTFVAHSGWSHISIWAAPYKYEWITLYA